jgi:tetratricopeptide (TPR) repeat protein
MLLVGTTVVVQGRTKVSESADSQSVRCLQCRVVAQVSPPAQSGQTGGSSSDELVRSLESVLSQGKVRKAHDLLNEVLKSPSLTSDTLLRVGIQFAERERYEEAAEAFERCIQEHPGVFEAYYNLALAEIAERKWEDALATLQQAPQKSRSEVLACSYLRGKVEGSQGKASQAEHDLSSAFEGEPQNPTYAMDLGLFYIQEHKYLEAAAVFEGARNPNPGSSFLVLGLALSRFLAGQPERSIDALRMLLSTHPNFAPARVLMTFVLSTQGKLEDAERVAHQGLNSPHASPYLYYLDASILVKLRSQQYTRIFEELSLARRGIPSCGLCYLTESKAHQSQGNLKAAIADLEMATRIDPTFSEAWYRLASLYRRAGREAEASRAQDQFQELRAEKEGREVQMLRDNFLQTLSAAPAAQ